MTLALVRPTGVQLLVFFCFGISFLAVKSLLLFCLCIRLFFMFPEMLHWWVWGLHAGWGEGGGLVYAVAKLGVSREIWPHLCTPVEFFSGRSRAVLLLWFTNSVIVCLCMYFLVKFLFRTAFWPILGKETVLLAFCL